MNLYNKTNNFIIKNDCYLCNKKFNIKRLNANIEDSFLCVDCDLDIFITKNIFMVGLKSFRLNVNDKIISIYIYDFDPRNKLESYTYDTWIKNFNTFDLERLVKVLYKLHENSIFE